MVRATEAISFEIPGLPVPCPRPRVGKHGVYYGERYEAWRSEVAWLARAAASGAPTTADVGLTITVYGAKRTGDWDNIGKGISDALQGVVYVDDKQVRDARVTLYGIGNKRTVIEVRVLE